MTDVIQTLAAHNSEARAEARRAYVAIIRRAAQGQTAAGDEVMLSELVRELNARTAPLTPAECEYLATLQARREQFGRGSSLMPAQELHRLEDLERRKIELVDPAADLALARDFFEAQTDHAAAHAVDTAGLTDALARDTADHNAHVAQVNSELASRAQALARRIEHLRTARDGQARAAQRLAQARSAAGDLAE